MKFLIAGLLAIAVPANAADQFDLICNGKATDVMTAKEALVERHYHIDLSTNEYCYNECTVRRLNEVNSSQIVFEETQAQSPRDHNASLDYVNRINGKWEFFTSYWYGSGSCEAEPFTSFPVQAKRF